MVPRTDEMTTSLADHASRGPRYTSYPPATQLGPISTERVGRELDRLGTAGAPISLYVHVPFCRSLCAYCGCNVIPTRDERRGAAYVDQLATEMTLVAARIGTAPVTEIAIGGGSPNFLAPASMRLLAAALGRYFAIAPDARRSIELDPRSTTSAQLETLASIGFTSLSVGVQDFSEPVQDAIRRHQSIPQTRWLVDHARRMGFDDLNIDIVYGLPRQTETTFAATVDAVIDLAPDRVALFGYAHLPERLPHQLLVERAGRILDRYERAALLLLAIERFTNAGYIHLGLDHFAKPGSRLAQAAASHRMVRTFQGYVEQRAEAIVGLGVSAISSTASMFWQNHPDLAPWEAAITSAELPVHRGLVLDGDDRLRRGLIDRLMCEGTADLREHCTRGGVDADHYFTAELEDLAAQPELGAYDPVTGVITTTDLGKLLVRNVCMMFDRYLRGGANGARFSQTI